MLVQNSPNLTADSMIHRGFNKKKMGQTISKKKEKQKREGLMTQMKNKTLVSRFPFSDCFCLKVTQTNVLYFIAHI